MGSSLAGIIWNFPVTELGVFGRDHWNFIYPPVALLCGLYLFRAILEILLSMLGKHWHTDVSVKGTTEANGGGAGAGTPYNPQPIPPHPLAPVPAVPYPVQPQLPPMQMANLIPSPTAPTQSAHAYADQPANLPAPQATQSQPAFASAPQATQSQPAFASEPQLATSGGQTAALGGATPYAQMLGEKLGAYAKGQLGGSQSASQPQTGQQAASDMQSETAQPQPADQRKFGEFFLPNPNSEPATQQAQPTQAALPAPSAPEPFIIEGQYKVLEPVERKKNA
jgi:hypothetical protein